MRRISLWLSACFCLTAALGAQAQEKPRPPENPKRIDPKDPKRIETKDPKRVEPKAVDPKDKYARGQKKDTFNKASGAKTDVRTEPKDKAPAKPVEPADKYAKNQIRDKFKDASTNASKTGGKDAKGGAAKTGDKKTGDKNGNTTPPSGPSKPKPPSP